MSSSYSSSESGSELDYAAGYYQYATSYQGSDYSPPLINAVLPIHQATYATTPQYWQAPASAHTQQQHQQPTTVQVPYIMQEQYGYWVSTVAQQPVQQAPETARAPRSTTSSTTNKGSFKCDRSQCDRQAKPFSRKADRDRHIKTVHDTATVQKFNCPRQGCDRKDNRAFTRKDHFHEHMRDAHNLKDDERYKKTSKKRNNSGEVSRR